MFTAEEVLEIIEFEKQQNLIKNKLPTFAIRLQLFATYGKDLIEPGLIELVKKGILYEGPTMNDKYYMLMSERNIKINHYKNRKSNE